VVRRADGLINNVTMLSMILTGAALIREREHGTIEHLLVMPVTAAEIMLAKVWSMGLVVAAAAVASLSFVVQGALHVPIPAPCRCSWPAWRCTCSRRRRWASFSRRWCAACRSSACCSCWCCCRCSCCRRAHAAREHAARGAGHHARRADDPFRRAGAAHPLSRRRPRRGVDAVSALFAIGCALFLLSLTRFRKTIGQMA
jgi:ABC-2 type transport system permease protein